MSCLAFDIHTGELVHESLFDDDNDFLYVSEFTQPQYDINNKYMGLNRLGEFTPLAKIKDVFW